MRFIRFEFGNIRRFAGEGHVFDFAGGKPGLHLVTGTNRARPEKGANGVGKTSLWDAVYWTLYGKTPRGQRGTSVRTWRSKGRCYGKLDFETDGHHTIEREQKQPMILRLDGKPVEQDVIDKLIGLPDELFKAAILQAQEEVFFFDLKPAAKLDLFTTLLDLDHWTAWAKNAGKLAATLDGKWQQLSADLAAAQATEQGCRQRLEQDQDADADWLAATRRLQDTLKDDLADAKADARRQRQAFDKQAVETDRVKERLGEALADADAQERKERRARDSLVAARVARDRADSTLQAALRSQREGKDTPENCPTCGQRLSSELRRQELVRLADEVAGAKDALKAAHAAYDAASANDGAEDEEARRLAREVDEERRALETERSKLDTTDRELRDADSRVAGLERQRADLNRSESPYAEQVERSKRDLENARDAAGQAEVAVAEAEVQLAAVAYWQTGFRDIRLELIEDALQSFEVEVNNQLADLGLVDWRITVDIERETKAGGVMKGFSVMIESPESGEPVPWESWSGGETQRLRLAGWMGLSSLIMHRLGVDAGIQVIDEPSEHLSPEGVADLVVLLSQRARQRQMQIWVIDHRIAESADVASVTRIINEKAGASIEADAPPVRIRRKPLVEKSQP